ncbi:MAPEG family protein [Pleurocapsa sp. PCC 7319]|uniref:MAPEG family protein n=1 Tax=Pleurocapsa sp. PCC 7319 TaxID=118161 RepID=UPI0003792370|nr:MAPEG family protein [Pleurocapsa sp. PCC 7319]
MVIYSAWLAAYLIVLQQVLMLTVGMHRTKKKQGMGVQDDITLERLVRRHGNLAENAGIFIASVALLEINTGSTRLVLSLCLIFAIARTLHMIGFSSPYGAYRIDDTVGSKIFFLIARAMGATISALSGIACGFAIAITLA